LSKGKNKNKVLNLYAAEITNQRAKKTETKSKRKQPIESSEDSTSEEDGQDMHIVDCPIEPEVRFKKGPARKRKKVTSEDESGASVEEGAFLAKIANFGQTNNTDDESTQESEDSSE
jgi:hypothetical protein